MNKAYIVGIGMTIFKKRPYCTIEDMGYEAINDAIIDAGIDPKKIEAVFCGHAWQGMVVGQRLMAHYGIGGIPITNIENACASGSCALREAYFSIISGQYDICLALGVEKLSNMFKGAITPSEGDFEGSLGITFPAIYALRATKYMDMYDLKQEQLASIAIKNRKNAFYNDRTNHGEIIDVSKVLESKVIASPLHLYDCNPISDGAAAVIIVNSKIAKKYLSRKVEVAASSLTTGKIAEGCSDITFEEMTHRAAQEVYHISSCGPEDISFAEVHDCFTIAEILRVEGLGLCGRGDMVKWIEEGRTNIDGLKPINPSGGLLGKGHPLGATGVAQAFEIARQLRGEAGVRQIKNAKVGLAHCRGGSVTGTEGGACVVHVFKK